MGHNRFDRCIPKDYDPSWIRGNLRFTKGVFYSFDCFIGSRNRLLIWLSRPRASGGNEGGSPHQQEKAALVVHQDVKIQWKMNQ